MRLDVYLVKNYLATGRDRAKEMILSGKVKVSGEVCLKPSLETDGKTVEVLSDECYVGRGAYKIKKAAEEFSLKISEKTCLDAGASTGGFTEYMLNCGAKKVYAVDVGHGQLAEKLRCDERVVNMEGTDIRSLHLDEKCSFFACDVSFISLKQVLFPLYSLTDSFAEGVCLIKPQFEVGRAAVGKKGVVKDKKAQIQAADSVMEYARSVGFYISGLTFSPVTGQNGNIEFLMYLTKDGRRLVPDTEAVVNKAWEALL